MGWKDMLLTGEERVVFPWVEGRHIRDGAKAWDLVGKTPSEPGWYEFKVVKGRTVKLVGPAQPKDLKHTVKGYLVGDRIVADTARVEMNPAAIVAASEPVFLLDLGLDRFVRVRAGRACEDGPLIFEGLEFPLGCEEAVLQNFLDEKTSVSDVKEVPPALDASFRMEVWQRAETVRLRLEAERRFQEEEAKRIAEERRRELMGRVGSALGRRELAKTDFGEAAKAALAMGGATYVDHRTVGRNEYAVRFRLQNQRFECTCNPAMSILDSGICLTAHYDDENFDEGTKGDRFFTLESLPSVIMEAIREHKLVVYRRW